MTASKVLKDFSPWMRWVLGIFGALVIAGTTAAGNATLTKFKQVNDNSTEIAVMRQSQTDIVQRLERIEAKLDRQLEK